MILFWILAAAMMVAAVLLLLPPLLGHSRDSSVSRDAVNLAIFNERVADLEQDLGDSNQRRQVRQELERELLQDVAEAGDTVRPARAVNRIAAVAVVLVVPLVSVLAYTQLGSRQALQGTTPAVAADQTLPADHPAVGGEQGTPSLERMVENLAERLQREPANLEGWTMLGRSYMVLERYPEARDAFAQAISLGPDDPELLSRYAEAAALAQGGELNGLPMQLVNRLLQLDSDHPNGLWLAGLAAYQAQDYREAVERWTRLAALVGTGPNSDTLAQYLAEARTRLGEAPTETIAAGSPVGTAATEGAPALSGDLAPSSTPSLSVRVSLAPELADRASPEDTVFIFARAAQGPRMPLAIVQRTVAELPVSVTLDDSMAMTPAMKLSNFTEVVIGARVSKTGNAVPQSGDLEGSSPPTQRSEADAVTVTINRVI
ncbi:MAG: c-type cytochrome biogenesis protein CcmI [Gammaproteobacteria bacterium]|nr:c-type cytochrome biogenesis protein CcmI [Gammaproteobacteria bacterium]